MHREITFTRVCDELDVDGGVVRRGVAGVGAVLIERRWEANVAHLQPHDLVGEVGPFTHNVHTISGVFESLPLHVGL